jgi:hypothetical protein
MSRIATPADPGEYYNVISKPKNAAVLEQLAKPLANELGEKPPTEVSNNRASR